MVRASKQRTFPEIPLAARKRCWTPAGQSCLKLIPVYTVGQEALSHAEGLRTQPIGMEMQRDSSMPPDRLNGFVVSLHSTTGAFENASY